MPPTCQVTSIAWDRVHLIMMIELADGPREVLGAGSVDEADLPIRSVRFVLRDGSRTVALTTRPTLRPTTPGVRDGLGVYEVSVNVTNGGDRRPVPEGDWAVQAEINGRPGPDARYRLDALDELDEASRIFRYDEDLAAYLVGFTIRESDRDPDLVVQISQMSRRAVTTPSLTARVRTSVLNRRNAARLANVVYQLARRLDRLRRLGRSGPRRILFASEMRAGLEGNLLRVRDRMVERGLAESMTFDYSFRTPRIATRFGTLATLRKLATADCVLIDDYFGILDTLDLAPETTVIQLWHAGVGFKAIGFSRFGRYGTPKLRNAHRVYDYAITGSEHLVATYAEAFGIEETAIVATGLPRIDTFLDPDRTARVTEAFWRDHPELVGKRLILFAPTFRGRGARDAYYDYDQIDFAALHDQCGDDTAVLFRMHHFVADPVPIPAELGDRLLDLTHYPDGNDLLHVTDLLVTDYSSIIYEFSLLDRPMLFFAYDAKVYAAVRGFHRDYAESAPGKVCRTFAELLEAIATGDTEQWKVARFREMSFDAVDTGSADRVIDWLVLGHEPRPATRQEENV